MDSIKESLPILCITSWIELPERFTGIVKLSDESKYWLFDGRFHREDGPAHESVNGTKEWWQHDRRHRGNGPAVEDVDGTKEWYFDDELIFDGWKISNLQGNYIVLERGIPTNEMFGKLKLTNLKLLTATGTIFVPDNLPGLEIGEGNE
jgi:hypothetical protein